METQYIKKDYSTLIVKEVVPQQIIPEQIKEDKEYSYNFLIKQKEDIQKQWDEQVAQKNKEIEDINIARQKELDEVKELLFKCEEVGITGEVVNEEIVAKPIEEIIK